MIWIFGNRSVKDGMVIDGVAHHDAVLKLNEFGPLIPAPLTIPEVAIISDSMSAKYHILNDIFIRPPIRLFIVNYVTYP